MVSIDAIIKDLRKEQQKMMESLYTERCKDKYLWEDKFEEVINKRVDYTKEERKIIEKEFSNCVVLLSTFHYQMAIRAKVV